jgi:hypothetical protein
MTDIGDILRDLGVEIPGDFSDQYRSLSESLGGKFIETSGEGLVEILPARSSVNGDGPIDLVSFGVERNTWGHDTGRDLDLPGTVHFTLDAWLQVRAAVDNILGVS